MGTPWKHELTLAPSRSHSDAQIPAQSLTHLLYCFADVRTESGEVFLSDAWSDEQIHYDGDSWDEPGTNLYGNFKAIYLLKKRHRQLKLLLSVGGWSYSSHFAPVACDAGKRAAFVDSAVRLVKDYGLDGLDIDWEYPANDGEAAAYVDLLRELRGGLDQLAGEIGTHPFQLTIAAPAGAEQANRLRIREMDPYLTFWNLMTYDMAGSWDSVAGHQAPLYGPSASSPSVHAAVDLYRRAGVAPHKLVMGMPLYGRAFENTDGPGQPFQGVGQGSWEEGTWDFKALPLPGAHEVFDPQAVASSCYNPQERKFVTYDNLDCASKKTEYIRNNGLGGAMWWELSGDFPPESGKSMVQKVAYELGNLDGSENHLHFPSSKWDNLRQGNI